MATVRVPIWDVVRLIQIRFLGLARGECGLMTLEWLLIVAAIAGLAASSVLAVQKVVDNSTDRPPRPEVLIVDAEIAAAFIAHEATEAMRSNRYHSNLGLGFEQRCLEIYLVGRFSEVVRLAIWMGPVDNDLSNPGTKVTPAKCKLFRV